MTPQEHFDRAQWWGNAFDALYSWADPMVNAGAGMGAVMVVAMLANVRAGCCAFVVWFGWFVVGRLHWCAGKFCVWRLRVNKERFEAAAGEA